MTISVEKSHTVQDREPSPMSRNISDGERIASIIGGTMLTLLGLSRKSNAGAVIALIGGGLAFRGISGFSPVYKALGISTADSDSSSAAETQSRMVAVKRSVTINRSPQELYAFWRNFENLPGFMKHLHSVKVFDEKHSHWVASAPMNNTVEWNAEITDEQEDKHIAWRSTGETSVPNTGSVQFTPAPEGRGTQVLVQIRYEPQAGLLGKAYLSLFGEEPSQQIAEDLRRFKALMETGEIATTTGQPKGRT
jgi:uncharacterized membrane protein